jgi:hypothetical protein
MRHFIHRRHAVVGALAAFAGITALAIASLGSAGPPSPAGSLAVDPGATLVDTHSDFTYTFGLRADTGGGGGGDFVLGLEGPGLSTCTVHGSGASVDFTDVGNEVGDTPSIQCGRAFGQSVAFKGCVATLRAHGYQHSDHPLAEYLGPTTIDVRFQKTGPDTGTLEVVDLTPAGKIAVQGTVSGTISMSTCP